MFPRHCRKAYFAKSIVLSLLCCNLASAENKDAPKWVTSFDAAGYEMQMQSQDRKGFEFDIKIETPEDRLTLLSIRLSNTETSEPPKFALKWSLPAHDIQGHWSSGSYFLKNIRADWWPSEVASMLARQAPVISLFGSDDQNRLTFAVSDALNTVTLTTSTREEDARNYNTIEFFAEEHRKLTEYEVIIRFDQRPIKFYSALQTVSDWWASQPGYAPATVPEVAREPMYSTWYSYHQNVSSKALLKEAKLARELGFKAMIIDDGWQTLDSNRGYAYTGDWQPEKMPDMKAFVDAAHAMDVKILLWYSLPFAGEKSKIYQTFKGKYLRYWEGQGTYELDPRYPDVRTHIINTYKTALEKWGVDGFKLDFIGRFVANDKTVLEVADGRDYASVNEATDRLMTDIMTELKILNPNIMIEFRQPYIGPLMRKYGNMFRVGDSPNAYVENRIGVADLRMLSGNTAVHSDMIMWHNEEPVETAALQFTNILFSVPQVSVKLADIPTQQLDMIRFYTQYWQSNQDVFLDGDFEAHAPLSNYPLITAATNKKRITGLYADKVIELNKENIRDKFDIVNGKASSNIYINATQSLGTYNYTIYDCQGTKLKTGKTRFKSRVQVFSVPVAGVIAFHK